ncbi:MAG TPA: VacJ family lipoprotein [Paracoccus sp.]|nr:VacJ family lipoprotein [Paracoccus sp. (in: a-proteobacteria)]
MHLGIIRLWLALTLIGALAACNPRPPGAEIHDPFEATNRAWFETNLALDRAVLGEEEGSPSDGSARRIVRNFGSNLSLPGSVINNLLQARPDRAFENTLRFAINTTVGLGGLFDPAGRIGLHGRSSDFGETLHVWGANEGAFVMLPFFGPSTERDAAGMVVDMVLDPFRHLLPGREHAATVAARLAARVADRAEYDDLIDANVMQSADPYAQGRLLFLQARRYYLGSDSEEAFIDPYADFMD